MEKIINLIDTFVKYGKKNKILLLTFLVIIFVLNLVYKIYVFDFKYKEKANNIRMDVEVKQIEKVTEDKVSYLVKYENNNFILNIYNNKYSNSKLLDVSKYNIYKYADIITLRGKITIPEKLGNPYEFDYKKYLNSKNIVGEIITYDIELKNVRFGNPLYKLSYRLKESVSENIKNLMPKREFNLFKSMLYGEDNNLDEDIKTNFTKCGLSHLLAVSGSNISALMIVLNYILKKLNKKNNLFVTLLIIFVFCIFCSFELSIIRASIMIVITIVLNKKEKKINVYLKIIFSYILIITYNPFYIFNIGLLMSYLAICGIVTYQKTLLSYFDIKIKKILGILYIKPKRIKLIIYSFIYIIAISISFTISSQIFLLPIQIYYFNSLNIISIISNLLVSYIDNFFSIIGFCLVFLSYIPYISNILSNSCFFILRVIINLTSFLSNFDKFNLKIETPQVITIIFYYLVIVWFTFRKYIIHKYNKKVRKNIYIITKYIIGIGVIYVFCSFIYLKYFDNYIIYFNVGQGNMALVHYNSKNILVDCGSTQENLASNILLNYCNKKNINKLDMVIITHFHTDHMNGINTKLLEKINIGKVIYTLPKEENKEYDSFTKILEENKITKVEVGWKEEINQYGVNIDFISPDINTNIKDEDETNANSLVTLMNIKNKNYLFMGDATKNTEKFIINKNSLDIKNIEVLQVGHHGSDTSSSDDFLNIYNIKTGIISSKKKVYNHPSPKTLNRLNNHNISVKITENNGAYKVKI